MIKSMTGFGKSTFDLPDKNISVEIKSLNSKQFDASLRLPPIYREKEAELRILLTSGLERGKIELNINIDRSGETASYRFNRPLAKQYFEEMKALAGELQLEMNEDLMHTLVKMPDVLKAEQPELSEDEWNKIRQCVLDAIGKLNEFRVQEGLELEKDLISHVENIENLLESILPLEENRILKTRERLMKQFEDSLPSGAIDMNRFEQEIIYYLEKLDISEEKVRLKKHCKYFLETLEENGAKGKKLAFISQEMGREINTLGSKANDADIQKIVVLMKDELEKIKEQLFNIL